MAAGQDFLGKGMHFPPTIKGGQLAMSSGEDLIGESIIIILGTAKGERVMRPDFGCGIQELVFAPNDTSTATLLTFHVKEALLKWEPRIEVLSVDVLSDSGETNRLNISIEYRVKTTNVRKNLVYPFYLEAKR